MDREAVLVGPAPAAEVEDRLTGAVARQLGLGAVGVEDPQVGHICGVARRGEQQHAVGEDPEVPLAHAPDARGGQLEGELIPLEDQIVVAEGLPLLEGECSSGVGV